MNRFLVDTSAYTAFKKGDPTIKNAIQRADELLVNTIVLGELLAGFRKGGRRKRNEQELETFLSSPRVGILHLDDETAERYAVIQSSLWQAGTPIPTNDLWIAASAMRHGLAVLTTDERLRKVSQVIVQP